MGSPAGLGTGHLREGQEERPLGWSSGEGRQLVEGTAEEEGPGLHTCPLELFPWADLDQEASSVSAGAGGHFVPKLQ